MTKETIKKNFTKTMLNTLLLPEKGKRKLLFDAKQPGLAIQITATGTKTFKFRHWDSLRRKPQNISMEKYLGTSKSIKDARKKASDYLTEINNGVDIGAMLKAFKDEDKLNDLFEQWINGPGKLKNTSNGVVPRTDRNIDEDRRRYNLYLRDKIGNQKVSWFTIDRIRKWHTGITNHKKQGRQDAKKHQVWKVHIKSQKESELSKITIVARTN